MLPRHHRQSGPICSHLRKLYRSPERSPELARTIKNVHSPWMQHSLQPGNIRSKLLHFCCQRFSLQQQQRTLTATWNKWWMKTVSLTDCTHWQTLLYFPTDSEVDVFNFLWVCGATENFFKMFFNYIHILSLDLVDPASLIVVVWESDRNKFEIENTWP